MILSVFGFRCRKVLNMRLFANEVNSKPWDQNVGTFEVPLQMTVYLSF